MHCFLLHPLPFRPFLYIVATFTIHMSPFDEVCSVIDLPKPHIGLHHPYSSMAMTPDQAAQTTSNLSKTTGNPDIEQEPRLGLKYHLKGIK